jgi:hypothetical protein
LLAVALAKTIVAEYDQRKRKFVSLDGSIVTNDIGYRRREWYAIDKFYFIFIYTPSNTEHTAGSSNATGSHTSIPGSSGSTQVNFTARDCFVTRFAKVDAHIALTAKGVKDGLNFPRLGDPNDK